MDREYKAAVFIGRFQPFHDTHLAIVEQGLEIADKVIVLVGSSTAARSIKNPFSCDERIEMIARCFGSKTYPSRLIVKGIRDYYYNHNAWLAQVQGIVDQHVNPGDSVALLGSFKDASSFYLSAFPQWESVASLPGPHHATQLRESLYQAAYNHYGKFLPGWDGRITEDAQIKVGMAAKEFPVPPASLSAIQKLVVSTEFADLVKEWDFTVSYKASWDGAPFPPTFVTADAIVECSGHVLVVKRKMNPGKGLYALPGGFVKQNEFIQNAALRELKEETGIRVDKLILEANIVGEKVFDHPDRSLRGRTITHGFHIKLKDGNLPEVKGGDDAEKAKWMPIWDVVRNEESFFEDHAHIINYFVGGW